MNLTYFKGLFQMFIAQLFIFKQEYNKYCIETLPKVHNYPKESFHSWPPGSKTIK